MNESPRKISGQTLDGEIELPGIKELLSILWNGGKIDFKIKDHGWSIIDKVVAGEVLEKEEEEMEEEFDDIPNPSQLR